MPAEANKALMHRLFEEGFHSGKLAVVDEIFHPNFVDRSTPEQPPGTEGVKDYISMVRTGFPDIAVTIDDLITTDDKVVVRTTWRGTHLDIYGNYAPTGRQVTRTMIQIFRVVDSKLYEEWSEGNSLEQQIVV